MIFMPDEIDGSKNDDNQYILESESDLSYKIEFKMKKTSISPDEKG